MGSIKAEDIPAMIRKGELPPLEHLDLSVASDNIEHVKKISLLRMAEFLAEARPDLLMAIQEMGDAGAEYLAKLRRHIFNQARQREFKPEENVVLAHCDNCDKSFPVSKDEASSIKECPFCHTGGEEKEETEPPAEEE